MDDDVTAVMNNTVNKVQRVQSNDKVDLVSEAKSEQIRLDNAVGFLPSDIQICSGIDESSNEYVIYLLPFSLRNSYEAICNIFMFDCS